MGEAYRNLFYMDFSPVCNVLRTVDISFLKIASSQPIIWLWGLL
jgi:hypothetical protein